MSRQDKLVSIITPTWNAAEFLRQCIDSVQSQTYQHWEHLIVDDHSADDTWKVIESAMQVDGRVRGFCMQENGGAAKARNLAMEKARGRYIAFLDGDDLWLPEKLEKQIEFMEATGAVLSYTAYNMMKENNEIVSTFNVPESTNYQKLLHTCVIGCSTAVYDTQQAGKVYMPLIKKRQDYCLWLKILRNGATARGMNEALTSYRLREDSLSSNKFSAMYYIWKVYRDIERLSLWLSVRLFVEYSMHAIFKYKWSLLCRKVKKSVPSPGGKKTYF